MDHLVAIDALDDLVHNAGGIPLSGDVRIARSKLEAGVRDLHATMPPDFRARAEDEGLLDRLDAVVANAKPVSLLRGVRVDKDELYEILDLLRAQVVPPQA